MCTNACQKSKIYEEDGGGNIHSFAEDAIAKQTKSVCSMSKSEKSRSIYFISQKVISGKRSPSKIQRSIKDLHIKDHSWLLFSPHSHIFDNSLISTSIIRNSSSPENFYMRVISDFWNQKSLVFAKRSYNFWFSGESQI